MAKAEITVNPIVIALLVPVVLVIAAALHDSPMQSESSQNKIRLDEKSRDIALGNFAKSLFPSDKTLGFSHVEAIPQYGTTAVRLVFEGSGEAWHRDPRAVHNDALWNRILKQDDYFMGSACGGTDDVLIGIMTKYHLQQVVPIVRQYGVEGPQFATVCVAAKYDNSTHHFK